VNKMEKRKALTFGDLADAYDKEQDLFFEKRR